MLERDALRGQVLAGSVTEVGLERLADDVRVTGVEALGHFPSPILRPVRRGFGCTARGR